MPNVHFSFELNIMISKHTLHEDAQTGLLLLHILTHFEKIHLKNYLQSCQKKKN